MKVRTLIAKLKKLNQNDEVLLSDSDVGEYGSQIEVVDVRRVYDNDARNGERRVAVITCEEYGGYCYDFIDEEVPK